MLRCVSPEFRPDRQELAELADEAVKRPRREGQIPAAAFHHDLRDQTAKVVGSDIGHDVSVVVVALAQERRVPASVSNTSYEDLRVVSRSQLETLARAGVSLLAEPGLTAHRGFTYLCGGTLDYFPNEDGIQWFCREVLPHVRRDAADRFTIMVVRARPTPAVHELSEMPGIVIVGEVDRLEPFYEAAGTVMAPIRTGGGPRIKISSRAAAGSEGTTTLKVVRRILAEEAALCCRRLHE